MKKIIIIILVAIVAVSCAVTISNTKREQEIAKIDAELSSIRAESTNKTSSGKSSGKVTFEVYETTGSTYSHETPSNLFDFKGSTKWCVTNFALSGASVEFKASEPVKITGYSLLTGNDNEAFTGRNPSSWELYGGNDGGNWVLLDSKSNYSLPEKNNDRVDFKLRNVDEAYEYFKLEITANNGANAMQLSDFSLDYKGADYTYTDLAGPSDLSSDYQGGGSGGSSGSSGSSWSGSNKTKTCSRCNGRGEIKCTTCGGTGVWKSSGTTPKYGSSSSGGNWSSSKSCMYCNGGYRDCPNC